MPHVFHFYTILSAHTHTHMMHYILNYFSIVPFTLVYSLCTTSCVCAMHTVHTFHDALLFQLFTPFFRPACTLLAVFCPQMLQYNVLATSFLDQSSFCLNQCHTHTHTYTTNKVCLEKIFVIFTD